MNSYERLFKRIDGEKTDHIPNLSILMSFAAKHAGIPYGKFCTRPEKMVEANLKCAADFFIDAVTVMSDPYAETHDFGAEIEFPEDSNPMCHKPLLADYGDIKKLRPKKPEDGARMSARLETIRLYSENVKGEIPIIGWVEGALAEFVDLRGMTDAMTDLFDEPEFVAQVLAICTEQAIMLAKAQIAAGADIIGVGDAAASVIGGGLYEKFALPYEKKIIAEIHAAGAKTKLHICGDTTALLSKVAETKTDIFDVDYMVDLQKAADILNAVGTAVSGNLNPAGLLLNGTPDEIERETKTLAALASQTLIISSGCEVPRDTPAANLSAIAKAIRGSGF